MRKSKKPNEIIVSVRTESVDDFFGRGKLISKRLDKGEVIPTQRIISFEDPEDLSKFLTHHNLLTAFYFFLIRRRSSFFPDEEKSVNAEFCCWFSGIKNTFFAINFPSPIFASCKSE